eukprot:2665579-Prymnesium_polylepis.2
MDMYVRPDGRAVMTLLNSSGLTSLAGQKMARTDAIAWVAWLKDLKLRATFQAPRLQALDKLFQVASEEASAVVQRVPKPVEVREPRKKGNGCLLAAWIVLSSEFRRPPLKVFDHDASFLARVDSKESEAFGQSAQPRKEGGVDHHSRLIPPGAALVVLLTVVQPPH